MRTSITKKLYAIDQLLEMLYAELKNLPDEVLNRKPGPGQWSVLQVMHHLIISEKLSEAYVRKKLSFNPELPNAGIMGAYRLFMLKLYLFLPFKFKAPKAVGDEALPNDSTLEETINAWRTNRASFRSYLENLPDAYFDKSLYKHPFAGKLSLGQMIGFFDFHIRRHAGQIRRTLKVVQQPA